MDTKPEPLGLFGVYVAYNKVNDTLTFRVGWGCLTTIALVIFLPLITMLLAVIS